MSQLEEFEKCFEHVTGMKARNATGFENSYADVGWKLWQAQAEEIERLKSEIHDLKIDLDIEREEASSFETDIQCHEHEESRLNQRIKELEQAFQWQPIETAPKDETVLLAKFVDGELFWIVSGKMNSDEPNSLWVDFNGEDVRWTKSAEFTKPSHWKALEGKP